MTTLNHLKKNESLYDKQLVVVNSSDRDLPEQTTSSFTYTFNQPIERVSKIDVLYTKIPKSFYNVNSDNATMSITTDTFNEVGVTTNLVVNDSEIENNIIEATNLVDGTVNKTNIFMSTGPSNIIKVVTKNTLLYVAGTYSSGTLNAQDFTGKNSGTPLTNIGSTDLFIAQYNLEQVLQLRFRIAGILEEYIIDVSATDDYILVSGLYNSFPLLFYSSNDLQFDAIVSDGFPNGFLSVYTTSGEFVWSINITGINNTINPLKIIIDEDNSVAYITGSYYSDISFYNKNHDTTPEYEMSYIGTTYANVFIAQYDLVTGVLNWATRIKNGIVKTISLNTTTLSNHVVVGLEYQDNLIFYNSASGSPTDALNSLELEGTQNICIASYNIDGILVNRFRIGGSSIESNVRIDINDNTLIVAGLYSSNPLKFYGTDDLVQGVLDINGLFNNIFIASFDITTQTLNWATNIYDISNNIDNLDVGLTNTNEVFVLGNYSTILKFNSTNSIYQSGKDLLNTSEVDYLFLAKYNIDGAFITRSYIETSSDGNAICTSINTQSNSVYITGSYVGATASLYNPDGFIAKTITNSNSSIQRGLLVSYVNNINNYTINNTTLVKRIICRTLTGSDLNYTLNLNAFAQELGFNTSQKFQASVFGSSINWATLDVNNGNDTLTIVFSIGNKNTKKFNTYNRSFKITQLTTTTTQSGYSPYSLAFELSKIIRLDMTKDTEINNTNLGDAVIYDPTSNLFYIIFGINGTFTILANNLSGDLVVPTIVSPHCVIADNLTNDAIIISDSAKLSIKLEEEVINQRFNNVSFGTAFYNTASSRSLFLNAIEGTNLNASTGNPSDILNDDFSINDEISFNSPWVKNDINETSIINNRTWTGSSISSNGQNQTLVANNDRIYITSDAGITWQKRETVRKWMSVDMTYDGFKQSAVALGGQIYVSDSNGVVDNIAKSWIPKDSNRLWQKIAISKTNGVFQSAVALNDRIYISSDSGNSWLSRDSRRSWLSIAISNDGLYQTAVAFNDFIYTSNDSGKTWSSTSVRNKWQDIALSENGDIQIAINSLGSIYKSIDYGVLWIEIVVNQGKPLQNISISKTGLYQTITSNSGDIYRSIDTGITWVNIGINESWGSIAVSETGQYQLTAILNGVIYNSIDYGATFNFTTGSQYWSNVAMSSDGVIQVACVHNGNAYMSYDSGNTWIKTTTGGLWDGIAISATGQYILAPTFNTTNSRIYKSDNYGKDFTVSFLSPGKRLNKAAISATGQYQLCGTSNATYIYVSNDYGVSFASQDVSVLNVGNICEISATGKYMIAYARKSNDYGVTWTSNIDGYSASISSDGKYQVMGKNNVIYISDNYGESWITKSVAGNFTEIEISANGQYIVATGMNIPFSLSSDFGATWNLTETGRRYSGLTMSADGSKLAASVAFDNIYQSTNFGITWKQTQLIYVDLLNRKPWSSSAISNSGKYVICGTKNDGNFASNDNGLTFTSIGGPSTTSADISSSGQYQILATGSTVYGSSNYGATWTYFTAGSGSATSVDMTEDGSVVIKASVSGQIWVSDVGGSGWPLNFVVQTPPVNNYYSVLMTGDGSLRYAFTGQSSTVKKIYKWTSGTNAWDSGTTVSFDTRSAGMNADGSVILVVKLGGALLLSKNGEVGPFVAMDAPNVYYYVGASVSPDGKTLIVAGSSLAEPGQNIWISYNGDASTPIWQPMYSKRIYSSLHMSQDGSKLVATESNGGIHFSYTAGKTWQSQNTIMRPSAISMDSTSFIQTVITAGGPIYTSINRGVTWNSVIYYNNWNKIKVSNNGSKQTALPYYGQILVSTDTGVTWAYKGPTMEWTGIAMSGDGVNQTATAFGDSIWISADSGQTWIAEAGTGTTNWYGVDASDDNTVRFAIVQNGNIYKSISGGAWIIDSPGVKNWSSITVSADSLTVLASVYQGQLYFRDASLAVGLEWTQVASVENWYDTSILDDGITKIYYAVSVGGQIYKSFDSISWVAVEKDRFWSSISASSTTVVIAVDFNQTIYQSNDSGLTWYKVKNLFDIVAIDSSEDLLIQSFAQSKGPLFVSNNNGVSFSRIEIIKEWCDISISSNGIVQAAAAYDDYIYVSTNSGVTWNQAPILPSAKWKCISVSKDNGDYITAAISGGDIWRSDDKGVTWTTGIGSGINDWESIDMTNDGAIQICVSTGGGVKSINSGVNWSSITIPVSVSDVIDVSVSGTNGMYQSIIIQGNGIYQSFDTGDTWSINTALPNRDYTNIDIVNDGSIQIISTNDDYVYYSTDFGSTWQSTYTIDSWCSIFINSDGSRQLVANQKSLYEHNYELGASLTLDVISVDTNKVNFNQNTSTPIDYVNIHGFNMNDGINYSVIRKTPADLVNVFVPNANYTPQTLVNTINGLMTNVNPAYTNAFSYTEATGKISFTPAYSGVVLSLTDLLINMGFTSIPNPATSGVSIVADGIINNDMSGPSNIFIKSDIIANSKMHKTRFSNNTKLTNLIAPLELHTETNTFRVPHVVELFLGKKITLSTIDIQIVDEHGNIVNLNNNPIQINFYFYST
jgi:hypothetical protein